MSATSTFRDAAIAWALRGDEAAHLRARELAKDVATAVLVEGVSDAAAIETLAQLQGLDLDAAGACVIPMGGVTNVAKFLLALGSTGIRLACLCDAGEEHVVSRALGGGAAAAVFVCVDDLEDELIRALGHERVLLAFEEQGDLAAFRTFQNQPAQRTRTAEQHLRRFLGTTAGRKEHYARVLVAALGPGQVPRPLADVLNYIQ